MKKWISAACVLLVFGIICCVLSGMLNKWSWSNFRTSNVGAGETREFECSDAAYKIVVEESSTMVKVESGNVDKITVSVVESNVLTYDISEDKGILTVRAKHSGGVMFDTNLYEVKVTVPKGKEVSLGITVSSGAVSVEKIKASGVAILSSSGSISVYDVVASEGVCVENTSGSISLSKIEAKDSILVNNTSGSKKLLNVKTESDLTVGGSSGSIKVTDVEAGGTITLENTSGSISGTIVGSASDYTVTSSTTSGSNNLANTTGGSKVLKVKATSGSVNISFTK